MPRYELNIARAGRHFARVTLNATRKDQAWVDAQIFCARFDDPSYSVTMSEWTETGAQIDLSRVPAR